METPENRFNQGYDPSYSRLLGLLYLRFDQMCASIECRHFLLVVDCVTEHGQHRFKRNVLIDFWWSVEITAFLDILQRSCTPSYTPLYDDRTLRFVHNP